jgi:murein DD-endopeptidase MepM/ murein hydrolase activator NlpD
MAIRTFPVSELARPAFSDAFGSHRGTDIFAPEGTALVAVDDGNARAQTEGKGGQVIYLHADDGTVYFYAHLSRYEGTFPRRVGMGQTIGYVGTTGNAQGKDPHVHFEVHPAGAAESVDPFPLLLDVAPRGSVKIPTQQTIPPNPLAADARATPKNTGLLLLLLVAGGWWLSKGGRRG